MKNLLRIPKKSLLHISKQRGEWAELQFMARASQHGLIVSKPWGDSAKYDFIVDSGGIVHRVQVKSTYCRAQRGDAYLCGLVRRGRGPKRKYRGTDFDFFAIFVLPADAWYIFPFSKIRHRWSLYLGPRDRNSIHFPYLEAWHLLRRAPMR